MNRGRKQKCNTDMSMARKPRPWALCPQTGWADRLGRGTGRVLAVRRQGLRLRDGRYQPVLRRRPRTSVSRAVAGQPAGTWCATLFEPSAYLFKISEVRDQAVARRGKARHIGFVSVISPDFLRATRANSPALLHRRQSSPTETLHNPCSSSAILTTAVGLGQKRSFARLIDGSPNSKGFERRDRSNTFADVILLESSIIRGAKPT